MLKETIPPLDHEELIRRRKKITQFMTAFQQSHNVDEMSSEELDLWIEKLRPLRMEMRAIDAILNSYDWP
jgi:hypothetical protein